jgi:hypothetical protein
MNWYFHSVPHTDSKEWMEDFRALAVEAIESWLLTDEEIAVQPEGYMDEMPPPMLGTFFANGTWYKYRFSAGWYHKRYGFVKLGPIPYNIVIERDDPAVYAIEVDAGDFPGTRFRKIDSTSPIE